MRTALILMFVLATAIPVAHAQTDQTVDSSQAVRTYSLMREDEDWSFLKDPSLRQDFWDPIKYIRLGPQGWFLTIGGEAREAFEKVANDNWGAQPYTNTFFLERYMLHTDWRFGKHFRAFVQLKSGLESFRRGGYRPIDDKKLDFEAAFVEIGAAEGDHWVVLQAGRQELNYGSGRLVSVREGPNVRQSFDGARLKMKAGAWRVDAFAARPDLDKPGYFDNVPDHRTSFRGVYATRPWRSGVSFDSYYLGLDRKSFTYNRGTAQETRHNLGARLWRPPATKESEWDFDYEAVWQFGSFGAGGIRAWTVAPDTGYSFLGTPLQPRVSVKADISSGDDPRSGSLGTFSPIFPIGNYFGVLADTGPGPVNFIDVQVAATSFAIPSGAGQYWYERLRAHSTEFEIPQERLDESVIAFGTRVRAHRSVADRHHGAAIVRKRAEPLSLSVRRRGACQNDRRGVRTWRSGRPRRGRDGASRRLANAD